MVTVLRPDEVKAKYGPMFCQGLYTIVDEKTGKVRIIEKCSAHGPAEWDVVNRRRTGGVIDKADLEGTSIIMEVSLGEKELNFGPASAELGGQGICACRIEGNEVRTTWYGIAGASVGVGACLPACKDVLRTEYPDDFKMGGGHTAHVDIITPKLVRVIIGVDDTDTKEKGATWATSLAMAKECPYGIFMEHKIIQLNPKSPTKTTNCCSTAVSFAVREEDISKLVEFCYDYVKKNSYSEDAVMTVFQGLTIPDPLREFGWSAKSIMYKVEDAERIAAENGVQIISVTGNGGIIGAVAAIGCADLGLEAAGVPEDFE
jgi:methanogenesis imperfect marker protein 11